MKNLLTCCGWLLLLVVLVVCFVGCESTLIPDEINTSDLAVVPGQVWMQDVNESNPFAKPVYYLRVLDVRDNWVKYQYSTRRGTVGHWDAHWVSMDLDGFRRCFKPWEGK